MKRKSLSKRVRFEVFKRDHFVCTYCGRKPPEVMLAVDHIVAVANGGSDEPDNLATSCVECNAGKSDKPLEGRMPAIPEEVRLEAIQDALERATTLSHQQEVAGRLRDAEGNVARQVQEYWEECFRVGDGDRCIYPDWRSIVQLLRRGLTVDELTQAVEIASGKMFKPNYEATRYYFGVCWTMLRKREGQGDDE